ncbi:MAG: hypothetical protein JW900_09315 [Anaerolineae bacterium]|nr:hypothetical protein [Anaerolineae bacterium]
MFDIGDPVVHPTRGAGFVVGFEEFQRQGDVRRYYKIKLLGQEESSLMIPIYNADSVGLRPAMTRRQLQRIWSVLRAEPEVLPKDYKARQKLVESKLATGDILQIAEAVRDMAWRLHQENDLTKRGKQIYQRSLMMLAAEVAASKGVSLVEAEAVVRARLQEIMPDSTVE